ncbi:MAG: hypothetical protein J6S62_05965 [Bacteroidales bacterium]|nr:hypothetical protein [Bacteroidales bacterium]
MKKTLLIAAAILSVAACTRKPQTLRNGDLIFVGIPADYSLAEDSMSEAIGAATSPGDLNIIHTAIANVEKDGSVWIIDATIKHGVDRHPLDTFLTDFTLKDGSLPEMIVMRLKDTTGIAASVERAKAFTGLRYNIGFTPCDTALYCTELVRDSYLTPSGDFIFTEAPMNFKAADGTMPLYWEQLFDILGIPVPQDVPGTNPRAMSEEPCLKRVNVSIK